MEILTSSEKFRPSRELSPSEINKILLELNGMEGITSFNVEDNFVFIEYYQQLLSPGLLKDALDRAGFPFQQNNTKKRGIRKLILKLGEENNKEFGGKPPKCCG